MTRYAQRIARLLVVTCAAFAALPLRVHPVPAGLDGSWAFALHYIHGNGLIHGRDVAATYGPLAWLAIPMAVGNHLQPAIALQFSAWALMMAVLAWIAFMPGTGIINLAVFTLCVMAGAPSFTAFGYAGFDMFLALLLLLLLAAATGDYGNVFYAAALAVTVLLLLIKFSGGMLALAAVFLFAIALLGSQRRAAPLAMAAAGLPVLFTAAWLLYDPSFRSLARYLRAGLELSSGYSAAMSLDSRAAAWPAALGVIAAWIFVAAALAWRRDPAFSLAAAGIGPLFLVFKHSFVREPGHAAIFFAFAPLLWGTLLLRAQPRKHPWWWTAPGFLATLALWYPYGTFRVPLRLPDLRPPADATAADRLPPELLARIGSHSIGIFPWEASYAAANPIRYRPFPVFQSYQAFTAWLDGWNASWLASQAPEFLLFEWDAIDGRHPLLDVPATALAIYSLYDLDSAYGPRLLLRRRAAPRLPAPLPGATLELRTREPLALPRGARPALARIYLRQSLAGWMRRFFFRTPPVSFVAELDDGQSIAARIPPDVLSGGIPLDFIPADAAGFLRLLSGGVLPRMRAIAIAGEGIDGYRPAARVELWEFAGVALPVPTPPAAIPARFLGALDSWRLETFNDVGLEAVARDTPVGARRQGYVLIRGWAVDGLRSTPAGSVILEIDGHPHEAAYGAPRPDIAALLHNPALLHSGFECRLPWWLAGGEHEYRLKIVPRDRTGYYEGGRALHLNLR